MFIYLALRIMLELSVWTFKLVCTNLLDTPQIYGDVTWYTSLINISIMVLTFLVLLYMMQKFHNFEYKRSKHQYILNFLIEVSIYSFTIYCFTTQDYDYHLAPLPAAFYLSNLPQILLAIAIYKYK